MIGARETRRHNVLDITIKYRGGNKMSEGSVTKATREKKPATKKPGAARADGKKSQAKKSQLGIEGESRMPAPTMGPRAQRTSALIADKARDVFLAKGYFGTSIDDIADAAGVSRASFYTYYPTKRDLLVKLGNKTYAAMDGLLAEMDRVAVGDADDAIERIVALYLAMLEEHGAFLNVWGQAGFGDEELRRAGMRAKVATSRRLAEIFAKLGRLPEGRDPVLVSLAFEVMIDRLWYYYGFADLPASLDEIMSTAASIISATLTSNGAASAEG